MGLATSIVWVLTIIAMGVAYVVIAKEKPKNENQDIDTQKPKNEDQDQDADIQKSKNEEINIK